MTRVLHVEDDDVDAEWVRRALASYQEPMELSRAVSVAEGCERLNEASYDVVVVDLTLPDADPSETLPQLLADHRELPVARLGGDEFVVILRELVDLDHAHQWMDRFYDSLRGGLIVDGETVSVELSTGLALAPLHGEERGELVDAADKAMYAAKRAGSGCWVLWDAVSVQASPAGSAH